MQKLHRKYGKSQSQTQNGNSKKGQDQKGQDQKGQQNKKKKGGAPADQLTQMLVFTLYVISALVKL